MGDAAVIRAKRGRRAKDGRGDAVRILNLLLTGSTPDLGTEWENRDVRQLLWHRHRMVQARTRAMNQLQAVAIRTKGYSARRSCGESTDENNWKHFA